MVSSSGIAHQVQDHVLDPGPSARLGSSYRQARRSGGPPLAEHQAGELVLLGHVVELVPVQVGPVVAVGGVVGEGEEAGLDPVHDMSFPTSWARASSCSR